MKNLLKLIFKYFGYKLMPYGTLPLDTRAMRNYPHYWELFKRIQDLPGDVVECGVGKGRTFLYLVNLARREGKKRNVWGFDSFEGFPEPSLLDTSSRNPKKGDWNETSVDDIKEILKSAAVMGDNVHLIKGFFPRNFNQYSKEPIAFLHLDVDLYQSYKDCLEYFAPFVVEGGIILFDEYKSSKWPGATRAIDEFVTKNGYEIKHLFAEKYYLIKH